MSGQDTDPKTSFEQYYEIERRSRSLARWLTAVCLIAAVATAAAFVTYGTGAITTAEKSESAAHEQYTQAKETIAQQEETIKDLTEKIRTNQIDTSADSDLQKELDGVNSKYESLLKSNAALQDQYEQCQIDRDHNHDLLYAVWFLRGNVSIVNYKVSDKVVRGLDVNEAIRQLDFTTYKAIADVLNIDLGPNIGD